MSRVSSYSSQQTPNDMMMMNVEVTRLHNIKDFFPQKHQYRVYEDQAEHRQ